MPALPTINVSDAQASQMLAAYGSVDGYQAWLVNSIIDFVTQSEMKKIDDAAYILAQKAQKDKDAAIEAVLASLPAKIPFPSGPSEVP